MKIFLLVLVALFLGAGCDKSIHPTAPDGKACDPRGRDLNCGMVLNRDVPTQSGLSIHLDSITPDPGNYPVGQETFIWATITNTSPNQYLRWQIVIVQSPSDTDGIPTPDTTWGSISPSGPDNPKRGMFPILIPSSAPRCVPYVRVRGCHTDDKFGYCTNVEFLSDPIETGWCVGTQ